MNHNIIITRDKGADTMDMWLPDSQVVRLTGGTYFQLTANGDPTGSTSIGSISKKVFKCLFGYTLKQDSRINAQIDRRPSSHDKTN